MMHTGIIRAYFHAPSKEEKDVELPHEMWSGRIFLSMGDSECTLYGTRNAASNWEDACATVFLREHQFERGVACPCSFHSRGRGKSGLFSMEMTEHVWRTTSNRMDFLRKIMDEQLRVEAHHDGGVQRSW